ncbi:MAG: hypothetical protein PSV13_07980, partial [Lacunisphaera sp.]|nr:hypothetical protein [Lacunisphaera sp.]
ADATHAQREQMRAVMTEVGITSFRDATPEQREQLRKLLTERGLIPAAAAPGEAVVTTRTLYRLPGGNKAAIPEPVSTKIGITDGSASEVIDGIAEGDTIIIGVNVSTATGSAQPATANPFSSGGRRF